MAPPLAIDGLVTSAHTRRAALAARAPVEAAGAPTVEQLAAPPSARMATDQPAGSAGGTTPAAVVAANVEVRLNVSLTAPVLVIHTWKRETVEAAAAGVTAVVRITAPAPAPSPSAATA